MGWMDGFPYCILLFKARDHENRKEGKKERRNHLTEYHANGQPNIPDQQRREFLAYLIKA